MALFVATNHHGQPSALNFFSFNTVNRPSKRTLQDSHPGVGTRGQGLPRAAEVAGWRTELGLAELAGLREPCSQLAHVTWPPGTYTGESSFAAAIPSEALHALTAPPPEPASVPQSHHRQQHLCLPSPPAAWVGMDSTLSFCRGWHRVWANGCAGRSPDLVCHSLACAANRCRCGPLGGRGRQDGGLPPEQQVCLQHRRAIRHAEQACACRSRLSTAAVA